MAIGPVGPRFFPKISAVGIIIIGASIIFSGTSYYVSLNYFFPGLVLAGVLILVVGMVPDIMSQKWDARTKLVLLGLLLAGAATFLAGLFLVVGNRIAIVSDMQTYGYRFRSPAAWDTSMMNAQFLMLLAGSCLLLTALFACIGRRLPEVALILVVILAASVIGAIIVENALGNAFRYFSDYPGSGGEDFHSFHVLRWCEARLGGILLLMMTPLAVAGWSFIGMSRRSVTDRPPEELAGINARGRLLTLAFFISSTLANFALGIISATGSYNDPGFVMPIIPEMGIVMLSLWFRSYFTQYKPWSLAKKGMLMLIGLLLLASLGPQIVPQNAALFNGYVLTVNIARGITGPAAVPTVVISAMLSDVMIVIWICMWFGLLAKVISMREERKEGSKSR